MEEIKRPQGTGYINWGIGGFALSSWCGVYNFIQKFRIHSVVEYGCGISTYLLLAINMHLLSLETRKEYILPDLENIIKHVDYDNLPELKRKYYMAFIDGPGAYEFESAKRPVERAKSVIHAMKYVNYIYMHDGGMGQIEPLEASEEWIQWSKGPTGKHFKDVFYIKKV